MFQSPQPIFERKQRQIILLWSDCLEMWANHIMLKKPWSKGNVLKLWKGNAAVNLRLQLSSVDEAFQEQSFCPDWRWEGLDISWVVQLRSTWDYNKAGLRFLSCYLFSFHFFMENWKGFGLLSRAPLVPWTWLHRDLLPPSPWRRWKEASSSCQVETKSFKNHPQVSCWPILGYVTFQCCFSPNLFAFPQGLTAPQSRTDPTGCLALHFPHENRCFHELCP